MNIENSLKRIISSQRFLPEYIKEELFAMLPFANKSEKIKTLFLEMYNKYQKAAKTEAMSQLQLLAADDIQLKKLQQAGKKTEEKLLKKIAK